MFTNDQIIEPFKIALHGKGFKFMDPGSDHFMNVIGIRSPSRKAGRFDDDLYLIFRNEFHRWVIKHWQCTTESGLFYLRSPLKPQGTAILAEGQYPHYKLDLHNKKYWALCQRLGPVTVYRDGNRDDKIDMNPYTKQKGMFGINIHCGFSYDENIGKSSAGCTVTRARYKDPDYQEFIRLLRIHERRYGNRFVYTLIEDDKKDPPSNAPGYSDHIENLLRATGG